MRSRPAVKPKDYRSVARNSPAHRSLALRAARQAERILPLFEKEHPDDGRPRRAMEAIRSWARGRRELGMAKVRKLSLDSHAAARAAKTDAARFAARAAGQAAAVWHVPNHALAVPYYVHKADLANKIMVGRPVNKGGVKVKNARPDLPRCRKRRTVGGRHLCVDDDTTGRRG